VTTLAQVFSRFVVVWGVGHFFPAVSPTLDGAPRPRPAWLTPNVDCAQAATSPIYLSMIIAWSLAEITRYLHYAAGLAGLKVAPLEWLR